MHLVKNALEIRLLLWAIGDSIPRGISEKQCRLSNPELPDLGARVFTQNLLLFDNNIVK